MHLAILGAALLCAAAPPVTGKSAAGSAEARFTAAKANFAAGEFAKALKDLDAAAAEAGDEPLLARIHLLRGQCHAVLRDFPKAEDAFLKALDADPESQLDPSVVRPSVVAILDKLRERLSSELSVRTDVADTSATLDGKPLGTLPIKVNVPIGRHKLEVRAPDGRTEAQEVVLRPRKSHELWIKFSAAVQAAPQPATPAPAPTPAPAATPPPPDAQAAAEPAPWPVRPFADLRGTIEATTGNPQGEFGLGVDILRHALVGADFTVGNVLGVTPRATFSLPELVSVVGFYASVDVPILFVKPTTAVGIGGAIGVEFAATRWLEPFVEGSLRRFLTLPTGYRADYVMISAGARVRIP
jgi:hypothetical protein